MKRPSFALLAIALSVFVVLAGCQKKPASTGASSAGGDATRGMLPSGGTAGGQGQMPPDHSQMMGGVEAPPTGSPTAAAGVAWTLPRGWTLAPERSMRVATYVVPAAAGDAEGGECGVFYFGPSQGGDVESNIQRWVDQFQGASPPERGTRSVAGMKVTTVYMTGTFLAPSGPMMQSTGSRSNYALRGAIVEAPRGSVFFKLTGPRRSIDAARAGFDALLGSIHTQ